MGSQEYFDTNTQEEDDEEYVEGAHEVLTDLSYSKLSDILSTKGAQIDLLKEEKKSGVVFTILKEHKEKAIKNGEKEKGRAEINKVQDFFMELHKTDMTENEFKLISDVALGNIRHKQMAGMISSLEGEIEAVKSARKIVKEREMEKKEADADEKKKESKKKQLDAQNSKRQRTI